MSEPSYSNEPSLLFEQHHPEYRRIWNRCATIQSKLDTRQVLEFADEMFEWGDDLERRFPSEQFPYEPRDVLAFHAVVGSTPSPGKPLEVVDFPGEWSADRFLDRMEQKYFGERLGPLTPKAS